MNTIIATSALAATATPVSLDALAAHVADDPAHAATEAFELAWANLENVLTARSRLGERLPEELRRSHITAWEEKIFEDDDPRWIAAEKAVWQAHEELSAAEGGIVLAQPITIAGVVAVLRLLKNHSEETGGDICMSRHEFEDVDGGVFSFREALYEQLGDALERIAAGSPPTPGVPRFKLAEEDEEEEDGDDESAGDDGTDDPANEMTESEKLQNNLATWRRVQALCADEVKSIEEQLQAIAA